MSALTPWYRFSMFLDRLAPQRRCLSIQLHNGVSSAIFFFLVSFREVRTWSSLSFFFFLASFLRTGLYSWVSHMRLVERHSIWELERSPDDSTLLPSPSPQSGDKSHLNRHVLVAIIHYILWEWLKSIQDVFKVQSIYGIRQASSPY